jgi:hypothetical protein
MRDVNISIREEDFKHNVDVHPHLKNNANYLQCNQGNRYDDRQHSGILFDSGVVFTLFLIAEKDSPPYPHHQGNCVCEQK